VKLVAMSGVSKPQVAGNMRAMMERDLYRFYPDREVRRHLHSVKKVITAGGNIIYDADRNEKHHADKFWARALMLFGAADADGAGRPAFMRIRMRASDD
jgi:phage FluMu gp28-like protein